MKTQEQASGKGTTWRPLGKNEVLPDMPIAPLRLTELDENGAERVTLASGCGTGERRCAAVGLGFGDCQMDHAADSRYCYYHTKLAAGVIEGCMAHSVVMRKRQVTSEGGGVHSVDAGTSMWSDISPTQVYPVWPLPRSGYVLLEAAVAA